MLVLNQSIPLNFLSQNRTQCVPVLTRPKQLSLESRIARSCRRQANGRPNQGSPCARRPAHNRREPPQHETPAAMAENPASRKHSLGRSEAPELPEALLLAGETSAPVRSAAFIGSRALGTNPSEQTASANQDRNKHKEVHFPSHSLREDVCPARTPHPAKRRRPWTESGFGNEPRGGETEEAGAPMTRCAF